MIHYVWEFGNDTCWILSYQLGKPLEGLKEYHTSHLGSVIGVVDDLIEYDGGFCLLNQTQSQTSHIELTLVFDTLGSSHRTPQWLK